MAITYESAEYRLQFEGLNALRGIAALAVVFFHGSGVLGMKLAPSGDLAVDFFFLLSGFVIAHAYEAKLVNGHLAHGAFFRARLARLYPIYLLSLVAAGLVILGLFIAGNPVFPAWQPILAMALAVFMLPMPPSPYSSELLYPLNPPSWSLAVELAINMLYAATLRWLGTAALLGVAATALALMALLLSYGENPIDGGLWPSMAIGYLRVFFSFPLGVVIYRHRHRIPPFGGLITSSILLVAMLTIDPPDWARAQYQLACVALVSPVALLGGMRPIVRFKSLCTYLGRTSYPLYALHFPAIMLLDAGAKFFGWDRKLIFILLILALLLNCWWIDLIDERYRKRQWRGKDSYQT